MPKIVIKGVRFSYCNLINPKIPLSGGDPKYSTTVLVPKTNQAMQQLIFKCIDDAIEEGIKAKWGGVRPPTIAIPVYDGDGPRPSDGMPYGEECKGHWVFTASSKDKPQVVDKHVLPILNQSDIYSGMYGNVSVSFYPYYNSGKKGVGCGLNNVMKTEEGEALGGRGSAASDFAEFAEAGDFAYQPHPEFMPQPVQYQPPVPRPIQYDPITGRPISGGV